MTRGALAVLVTSAAVLAGSAQAQTPAACKAGVDLVKQQRSVTASAFLRMRPRTRG